MVKTKVGYPPRSPSHDISLSDLVQTFGFRLDGGPGALVENPATPSTLQLGGGQGEFGDGDPHFRNVEQTDWRDGVGFERFDSLAGGIADSMNAFTMKEDKLFPAPQWKYSTGYRSATMKQPGNMGWYALHSGNKRYISDTWTQSGNLTADKAYFWIKRVGDPGTLELAITSNSGGSPSTELKTVNITTDDIDDVISVFQPADWTSTESLVDTTIYHIKFTAASTDGEASHWEIGINSSGATGKTSTNDSTWTAADFSIYFRIVDADVNCRFVPFTLLGGHYVCQIFDNTATACKVWLQGVRGEATSVTATTTTDSALAMTADEYIGATLLIVEGPGIGEYRAITDNDATSFTHAAFDTTLTTASNFVVLGSTKWTEVSTTGLASVKNVAVLNDIAYFSQGEADNIRKMGWNGTTKAHQFEDDSTNKASFLLPYQHRVDGPQMWRANNKISGATTVSRANDVTTFTSDLSYGTAINVGGIDGEILWMEIYDRSVWVFRNDQPYTITNDKAEPAAERMRFIPSPTNGLGAIAHDVMLFIPWAGFTLQQFYGGSLRDVTRRRTPSGRGGAYTSGLSHPAGLFEGVDAGNGTSSVLFRNDDRLGWHEVFRAWEAGQRVRKIWWEHNPLMRPKLWISVGSDLVYQEWPIGTLDPLQDSGMNYQHEAVIEMASIDLNAISLPKYIEEIRLISENLTASIKVGVDVKVDNDSAWVSVGDFVLSPEMMLKVERGDLRRIAFRLRMQTSDSDVPPIVDGIAIKGFARTPFKRYWTMRVSLSDSQRTYNGSKDHKPVDVLAWLRDAASRAQELTVHSGWADLDGFDVLIEPYSLRREYIKRDGKRGDVAFVTFREA